MHYACPLFHSTDNSFNYACRLQLGRAAGLAGRAYDACSVIHQSWHAAAYNYGAGPGQQKLICLLNKNKERSLGWPWLSKFDSVACHVGPDKFVLIMPIEIWFANKVTVTQISRCHRQWLAWPSSGICKTEENRNKQNQRNTILQNFHRQTQNNQD